MKKKVAKMIEEKLLYVFATISISLSLVRVIVGMVYYNPLITFSGMFLAIIPAVIVGFVKENYFRGGKDEN